MHHTQTRILFAVFVFFLIFSNRSFAAFTIDSETSREAIVAPRTKKFYKTSSAKKYLSIGGVYSSDYNSTQYQLNTRYLYQSDRQIHEFNFLQETDYADSGSGKTKSYKTKSAEIYDGSLASKFVLGKTKNYGVLYHRTVYDQFSDYYYDHHSAAGFGRILFGDKVEFDVSVGRHVAKNYPTTMSIIPSIRINTKLSENLTFIQRAYYFYDFKSTDNEIKTSLVYRLNQKLSFELRYAFEQRRYKDDDAHKVTNLQTKTATIGLVFDLQ